MEPWHCERPGEATGQDSFSAAVVRSKPWVDHQEEQQGVSGGSLSYQIRLVYC